MRYFISILLSIVILSQTAFAQWEQRRLQKPFEINDSTSLIAKENPLDYSVSLGTEVSFMDGYASSIFWISPDVSYKVNPKFTLRMGFTYATDILGNTQFSSSKNHVDLSPRERRNNQAGAMYIRGEYQANEKLGFAATAFYTNGMPTWCSYPFLSNEETIGVSAEMRYRFNENSAMFLRISFSQNNYLGEDFLTLPSKNQLGTGSGRLSFGTPSAFSSFFD